MKNRILTYGFVIFFLGIFTTGNAQQLAQTNTSKKEVRHFQYVIRQNRALVDFIEKSLVVHGLPTHLRNLALIESGLNHKAVSHAGAKGLWQLMEKHAELNGIDGEERTDVYKSTQAVMRSLRNLYRKYENWITVVAAYNCGTGNIQKAMNKAGSNRYTAFAEYLPLETQNHVKRYLDACYASGELNVVINNYHQKFPTTETQTKTESKVVVSDHSRSYPNKKGLEKITINAGYKLGVIAGYLKIKLEELLGWNQGIEERLREKGKSALYLPSDLMVDFRMHKNNILVDSLLEKEKM